MTYQEFASMIRRTSYKPGYTFHVLLKGEFATVQLSIEALPNASGKTPLINLTFSRVVAIDELYHQGSEFAKWWIKNFVRDWEQHETAEWLKIDGKLVMEAQGHGPV